MAEQLSERAVAACLRAAVAAPSMHNTQPWRFRFDGAAFDVFPDAERALHSADPDGRALHISVGAAVCNLRVALAAGGRVSRLEPAGERSSRLELAGRRGSLPEHGGAAVRVIAGGVREPSPDMQALALAIARRRTNREPFADAAVPSALLESLQRAAATGRTRLVVLDPVRRGAVLAITQAADAWLRADPGYRRELARWTSEHADRRDGVSAAVFGAKATTAALPLRDFGLELPRLSRAAARFERHPTVVVLHARGDTPAAWLEAGAALQRVLLTATVHGLSAQPMTQALEVPHLRRLLTPPGERWYPQMILRIGYGDQVAASPRRPLRTFVTQLAGAA
ncbi:Acg family FMN-binding oxidoreductase [Dactylosporangium matsuzakiense]|uniref:Nitroreductase n=1 Tax=Dactylosporangium matsuzakiense TaxID=53360 RepID=A0A9W6KIF0_9ACTN|nr:nitroreductase family protein [Dactylosporangium matsuzakiense]UWZ48311.1 nitroreductase family protein [Dactylosporangium matsuzakiense]GLL01552.1 nitroreductase [Dactylosporangium matsuzakiense]